MNMNEKKTRASSNSISQHCYNCYNIAHLKIKTTFFTRKLLLRCRNDGIFLLILPFCYNLFERDVLSKYILGKGLVTAKAIILLYLVFKFSLVLPLISFRNRGRANNYSTLQTFIRTFLACVGKF